MNIADVETFTRGLADEFTSRQGVAKDLVDAAPGVDDTAVVDATRTAVRLRNLADHLLGLAAAAAERNRIPTRLRMRTTADLLTSLGAPPAVAARAARAARALASLPTVAAAAAGGGLAAESVDSIVRGIRTIASRVDLSEDDRSLCVRTLLAHASSGAAPSAVDKRAREIAIELAAEQADVRDLPVAEDPDLNEMTLTTGEDGRVHGRLDLDVAVGESLFTALDALCRPVPGPDGSDDPRSAERRRADALGQILTVYLSHRERPEAGGVLPHVSVVAPATGVAHLGYTGPISATTADLLACDAVFSLITVDEHAAPLDVGRDRRLATPAIRKALAARDCGCAFPGCGRPVSWCDAHHVRSWADGGETSLDNMVLLCRMHHTMVHRSGWEVFIGHDRHPWFYAPRDPARPNCPREALRSHGRRTPTLAA